MSRPLPELEVLVLDCQASGATPAHGDLLELAWAVCGPGGVRDAQSHWVKPRSQRRVSAAVRELTGWSEACLSDAQHEQQVWSALQHSIAQLSADGASVPTLIHFARFELPFLRDLQARLGQGELQLDVRCLHAMATRLYPDLPRRNIRALAGFLGHSPELLRRSAGHVEASAFIWRALLSPLSAQGVHSWDELSQWLAQPAPRTARKKRTFPLPVERRRALPDGPGVYRFLRRNGDVLYVGKAASVKRRIAGHFRSGPGHTERALELLSQVQDIAYTETASVLEAALLECDEIKSLDPPYNVQLRLHERQAWFASRDLGEVAPRPDATHVVGPLPSRSALAALPALATLAEGAAPSARLCALALAVPSAQLPDSSLFAQGFAGFQDELLAPYAALSPLRRVQSAALSLWLARRRNEGEVERDESAPEAWDLARVRRRLKRNLVQGGLLVRRARWLCLLAGADVVFREPGMSAARLLRLSRGEVIERQHLPALSALEALAPGRMGALPERRATFDAARYDRLRVIATELARIHAEGGELTIRVGKHLLQGESLRRLLAAV